MTVRRRHGRLRRFLETLPAAAQVSTIPASNTTVKPGRIHIISRRTFTAGETAFRNTADVSPFAWFRHLRE
jgi:hypothetical protein